MPTKLQSHSLGGAATGSQAVSCNLDASELISTCPHLDVDMGGAMVPCLVDTGSMVTTLSESFFHQHLEPWGQERLRACRWLELSAANGLTIPYLGYLELDVQLLGKLMPHCGVFVLRDPPGGAPSKVPGILGMNVIRKCYQELFVQYGEMLFSQACVSEAPKPVVQALQQCHHAIDVSSQDVPGRVKVRGKRGWRIPGGAMKIVAATCSEQYSGSTVLFEPSEAGLPAGLLASPSLVRVIKGTAYIPVTNVGCNDVVLYPRTVVGTLDFVNVVSLPSGVTEVPSGVATVSSQTSSQTAPPSMQQVESVDLSSLSVEE